MKVLRKTAVLVTTVIVASFALAAPASAAITDSKTIGHYTSSEACGRASVNYLDSYWNRYTCTEQGQYRWRLSVQHDDGVTPPPAKVWTLVKSTYIGTYSSGEACGRTGYNLEQADPEYNGHRCDSYQSWSQGTLYQLYLTKHEWR